MNDIVENSSAQLRLIPEPCRGCGGPIDAISPPWYRLDMDLTASRVSWRYEPDETALCTGCALKRAPEPEREQLWDTHLEPLLSRKHAAKLPESVTMFHHRTRNTHVSNGVNGVFTYHEFFVHATGQVPEGWRIPRRIPTADDGSPMPTLIYIGSDVQLEGVAGMIRLTWDITRPEQEGTFLVHGWRDITPPDLSRLMEGVRVFMIEIAAGRPRGSTYWTLDEIRENLATYLQSCEGEPRRDIFLDHARIPKPTWDRYMRTWSTNWTTLLKESRQTY